jgi:hypothetical protein
MRVHLVADLGGNPKRLAGRHKPRSLGRYGPVDARLGEDDMSSWMAVGRGPMGSIGAPGERENRSERIANVTVIGWV